MQQNKIQKVLILVPDLRDPGGVTNYYKTLRFNSKTNIQYFEINKVTCKNKVLVLFVLLKRYLSFFLKLLRNKYQVVVINPSLDRGKSFHRDALFILISHFFNKKTIVFFHGWFEPYEEKIKKSKFKSFVFKISYAKVDRYIVLGNIFKKKLLELGVSSKSSFFIETMVADSSWLKELSLEKKFQSFKNEIRILFLSRIENEKGIYIAIDAFRKLTNNNCERKVILVIAGDGPDLNVVRNYVEKNKILNIQFVGHVSGDDKKKVLLDSHILILPSFTEGLPNVILEGMLYGMPIISRITGGIPEIIKQGTNGYLSESYNPEIFANFLIDLISNNTLYEAISKNNNTIAKKMFLSENVKARVLKIIENY